MKVTFPHMGNTYIPVKAMFDDLGVDYVIPPFNNKKAMEIGTKYAPELACMPLKINIGNFIQAYEMGADTVLIAGGCGPCRFGYYCEMHREILKYAGYEMDFIALELPKRDIKEFMRRIKRLTGSLNPYKLLKAVKNVTQVAMQVDELEKLSFRVRAREVKKGSSDRIYKAFLNKAKQVKGSDGIKSLIKDTREEMLSVEIDRDIRPLRVGIVGEIYTTIDSYSNFNIESKLGGMGIECDRSLTVSGWIVEHMLKNVFPPLKDLRFAEAAKPYLGAMIGGHAQETIGNTILYARDGYDGIIQVYPLTCMPEIVAESILPAVEKDFNIPILTLIIDQMTGEAGYLTRIEAFADLLGRRRERKEVGETFALSRN